MSDQAEEDRFAEFLMRVRDEAIADCDRLATGKMIGPIGDPWPEIGSDERTRRAVESVIPDIVDKALFVLVDQADNGQIPLAWLAADGSYVPLDRLGTGGLGGSYMALWRKQFSSQRFLDEFSDMELVVDTPYFDDEEDET